MRKSDPLPYYGVQAPSPTFPRRSTHSISSSRSSTIPPLASPGSKQHHHAASIANMMGRGDAGISAASSIMDPINSGSNMHLSSQQNYSGSVSSSHQGSGPSSPHVSRSGPVLAQHLISRNLVSNALGGGGGGANSNTVCEYCGVSYLTMSEMRALQTKVKDQDERLNQLKETVGEANKLKDTMANIRKIHRQEMNKRDEECQRWVIRCTNLESEIETLKMTIRDAENKNGDLAQKYAIASDDFKQQEEVICQLRSKLQNYGDFEAEVTILRQKNLQLEDNLQKLLQENKSLRVMPSHSPSMGTSAANQMGKDGKTGQHCSTTETALKAKVAELSERCNRLSAENDKCHEEIDNLQRKKYEKEKQDSRDKHSSSPASSTKKSPRHSSSSTKVPSVVTVEVHDLKRENAILNSRLQTLADEHSNCQDMHAFLRESIEKLKGDNVRLVDEMNGVKVKYEESLVKIENFQAVISGYQAERNRFMNSYKELQNKMEQLAAQNRAFHKSSDPKLIEQLRSQISSLERQIQSVESEKTQLQLEFNKQVAEFQREMTMEKERADSCLTQSLTEREEVEKRWQDRWARHHSKLTDQLEILKTNYEGSLSCAKERESILQQEIRHLQDRLEKLGQSFDEYKVRVIEHDQQSQFKFEELEQKMISVQNAKVDVEVMFQDKTRQLEELHEAVRQGCEERQDLQRRNEELERNIQETFFSSSLAPGHSTIVYTPPPPPPPPSHPIPPPATEASECALSNQESTGSWRQGSSKSLSSKKSSPRSTVSQRISEPAGMGSGMSTASGGGKGRPTSPFAVMGGKVSAPCFTVSSSGGKNFSSSNATTARSNNTTNNSTPVSHPKLSIPVKDKGHQGKTKSTPMIFSVAPPNVQRKAHRR